MHSYLMRAAIYLLYYIKRQMKQISFCLLLILLPCVTFAFSHMYSEDDTSICVALYTDSDELDSIIEKLINREGTIFFYRCSNEVSLYQDVSTGHAECGYVFPSTLYDSLDADHKNNLIQVIISPYSTLTKVINEVVYSEIFEEYSLHLLEEFIENESPITMMNSNKSTKYYIDKAVKLYHDHLMDGSTFRFIYESPYQKPITIKSILMTPIRGFISLFILLAAFCGCIRFYNDKENHIYDNRAKYALPHLLILSITVPTILMSIVGLFCLFFTGIMNDFWIETLILGVYNLLVILFVFFLGSMIRKKMIFISTIPIFLIGSILFTPIFLDISAILPSMKAVQYLFLPFYYLTYWS